MKTSYRTTILAFGNNTGIEVPAENLEALGPSKKPKVDVTINDSYRFTTTVASRAGRYLLSFSKDKRVETGLGAGDNILVELELGK